METKNKVQLSGHLSRDPFIGEMPSGRKWVSVSLCTTENYVTNQGVNKNNMQFHPIKAFGKIAEQFEKDCRKGTKLSVEGRLSSRTYDDKEGKKKYVTEVEVTDMTILQEPEPMAHLQ